MTDNYFTIPEDIIETLNPELFKELSSPKGIVAVLKKTDVSESSGVFARSDSNDTTQSSYLFDKKNIILLDNFSRYVHQLPSSLQETRDRYQFNEIETSGYLGQDKGKSRGISAEDIYSLFQVTTQCGAKWPVLRKEILSKSTDISDYFTLIDKKIKPLISTLEKILLSDSEEIAITPEDISGWETALTDVLSDTQSHHQSCVSLYEQLKYYANTLQEAKNKESEKQNLIKMFLGNINEKSISNLETENQKLRSRFDELNESMGKASFMQKALFLELMQPILKDLNNNKDELKRQSLLYKAYGNIDLQLRDIFFAVTQAQTGLGMLTVAWNGVRSFLEKSLDESKNTNRASLVVMHSGLVTFYAAWEEASNISRTINTALVL